MNRKLKIYVGCSLTCAPPDFPPQVKEFKKKLGEFCEVLCFHGFKKEDETLRIIYVHDIIKCVGDCDAMIGVCDFPSTGLGYEMGTVVEKHRKPLLALAQKHAKVSDLIMDTGQPDFIFDRYDELLGDGLEKAKQFIANLRRLTEVGTLFSGVLDPIEC